MMTPDRVQRVVELIESARDLPDVDSRTRYVRDACGNDEELRDEALSRLVHAAPTQLILDNLNVDQASDRIVEPKPIKNDDTVGRYRIIRRIAEGAFGIVYEAEQTYPVHKRVALKMLKRGLEQSEILARFELERDALALMNHTNVAQVLDAGTTEEGRPYFVMEYVAGMPITRYCDDHQLSIEQRLRLFLQVCEGVEHSHQKGVIHRDIKPSNVLVTLESGRPLVKVIDFGVAKAVSLAMKPDAVRTCEGQIIGTLAYMSPEQARLTALDIDTRSDIYSLGALLYEMLAGETPLDPHRIESLPLPEIIRLINEEEPPRLENKPLVMLDEGGARAAKAEVAAKRRGFSVRALSSALKDELSWIVSKAIAKLPAERFKAVSNFSTEIQRHLGGETLIETGPPSVWYPVRKFLRKHRGPVAAACTVLAALVLGLAATLVMYARAEAARLLAVAAQNHAEGMTAFATNRSQLGQAAQAIERSNPREARALLESLASDQRKTWPWKRIENLADRSLDRFDAGGAGDPSISVIAAAGETGIFATASPESTEVRIWRLDRAAGIVSPVRVIDNAAPVHALAFSNDGIRLALGDSAGHLSVYVADSSGRWSRQLHFPAHEKTVTALAMHPDAAWLASASPDMTMRLWSLDDAGDENRQPLSITSISNTPGPLGVNPNGTHLALVDGMQKVILYHIENPASPQFVRAIGSNKPNDAIHHDVITSMAFHPEGKLLATAGRDRRVILYDLWEGEPNLRGEFLGHNGAVTGVAFLAGGSLLATASEDRTARVWHVAQGKEIGLIGAQNDGIASLIRVNDDRLITATMHGEGAVWASSPNIVEPVLRARGPVYAAAFTIDGARLITAGKNRLGGAGGPVQVWNTATALLEHQRLDSGDSILALAVDPSGRWIATAAQDRSLRLLETTTLIERHAASTGRIVALAFDKNSSLFSLLEDGAVMRYDRNSRTQELIPSDVPLTTRGIIVSMTIAPDGRLLAVGTDQGELLIWNVEQNKPEAVMEIPGSLRVETLAFDRTGFRLAASAGESILVWTRDGDHFADPIELRGNNTMVLALAFHPTDSLLVSGSIDGLVRIWDLHAGLPLADLYHHADEVRALAFSPDGMILASASVDETIKLWEAGRAPRDHAVRARAFAAAERLLDPVNAMFTKHGMLDHVLAEIPAAFPDAVERSAAVHLALMRSDDPELLHEEAWFEVLNPHLSVEAGRIAVEKVRIALRLRPYPGHHQGAFRNTLGVALFRAGEFNEARQVLEDAERWELRTHQRSHPANLAFLALALRALGDERAAAAVCDRFRALIANDAWREFRPLSVEIDAAFPVSSTDETNPARPPVIDIASERQPS